MESLSNEPLVVLPLSLPTSVRARAEEVSAEEGVTLDEFLQLAVTEKIAHHAHLQWLKRRKVPTEESLKAALAILDGAGTYPPEPGDELPEGWKRL